MISEDVKGAAMARIINRKTEMNRAAIYARVSDKSQDGEDKTSLSEQTADMEAYCARKGLRIVARYQEVGRGWSKKRPEFQRMLDEAREGRFDTVVCWKSDRLSRGMYPAAALMEVVEAYQIGLEAVMDSIDMKTFGLMAAIGKIELDNFRERATMGKRGTAKQGRIPSGGVPYGYRIGADGKPAVVEAEAEIVQRIFRQYVHEGLGIPSITSQLEEEGVPTGKPSGKRWYGSHLNRILRNEAYRGTWTYGRSRHVSTEDGRVTYQQPEENWIEIPFPPLVDERTWDQAQKLRKQRLIRSKRNTKVFYLLQHLVRCAECGMLFGGRATNQNTVRRRGKLYQYHFDTPRRYYQCYGMQKHQSRCRQHPFIRAERLEDLVWGEVTRVLQNPEVIVNGIDSLNVQEDRGAAEELAKAERDLRDVQMEEDRCIRLYVSGKITEGQLDRQRKFVTERLESLRARVEDFRAQRATDTERQALAGRLIEWARNFGEGTDGLNAEQRREILLLLVDSVAIDRDDSVSISLAIPTGEFCANATPNSSCSSAR